MVLSTLYEVGEVVLCSLNFEDLLRTIGIDVLDRQLLVDLELSPGGENDSRGGGRAFIGSRVEAIGRVD